MKPGRTWIGVFMVLVSSSIETEEGGKIDMDDTDGQAHSVIMLPSFSAFFLSSSFFFPFHAVLPGQKFANGQSGVRIWPEMGRFRFYKWPTIWPAFCPLFCSKMVQFGAKNCLGNMLRHEKNQYPY